MHGFIHPQSFHVWQRNAGMLALGHLLDVVITLESNEVGLGGGLYLFEQRAQRVADPRHHDRPSLHAAVPVDSFFERRQLQDLLHAELTRLCSLAFHRDCPRAGFEVLSKLSGLILGGTEFVEVVVGGYVFESAWLFAGAERALREAAKPHSGLCFQGCARSSRATRNAAGKPERKLRRLR